MLTKLEIMNGQGQVLALSLRDSSSGYLVKEIDGLDPVKATLVSSNFAQIDGAQYQTSRRDPRNITMKLGLWPAYAMTTAQALRMNLYKYAMPKSIVSLRLYLDDVLFATTTAVVESVTSSLFTSDPEVDFSFMCFDPDFYSPSMTTVHGATTSGSTPQPVNYAGSSDAGVVFTLNIDQSFSAITLHNTRPDSTEQVLEVGFSFLAGDVLVINTIPGQKAVTLTRSGITSSLLYGVVAPPGWTSLAQGLNNIRAFIASGTPMAFTMTYTPKYGGL